MRGIYAILLAGAIGTVAHSQQADVPADSGQAGTSVSHKQFYEIRRYVIGEDADAGAIDRYLSEALLPALGRAGTGPVGLFGPAEQAESQDRFVVITYDRLDQLPAVQAALDADAELRRAAEEFEAGGAKAPYQRISSELLLAMDAMPQAKSGESIGTDESRVYELRIYESANEGLGDRKVEMFNEGEVPIFLDSGIIPVFLGQALVSPYAPSLTYLTAYPDEQARQQAWKTFVEHPDWKVLSGKERYQGTVSKIYKFVLRPLPGSQL